MPPLPKDLSAERTVLGSAIKNIDAAHYARKQLEPDDFHDPGHRKLFTIICDLLENEGQISAVLVKHELETAGELEKLGGVEALKQIMQTGYYPEHDIYCKHVREERIKRELIQHAQWIRSRSQNDGRDIEALLDGARQGLTQVETLVDRGEASTDELLSAIEQEYEEIRENDASYGIETGCDWIDKHLRDGGIRRGHLAILGGRPSSGKTALAVNVMCHAAVVNGHNVLCYSAEQSRQELYERAMLHMTGLSRREIISGTSKADRRRWEKAKGLLQDAPIYVTRDEAQDIDDITADAEVQATETSPDLVIVDYIHRLTVRNRNRSSRQEQVAYISQQLKKLAGDLDTAVLALAQLNRESGRQEVRAPKPTDLRSSGALEQDADVIILLARDDLIGMKAKDAEPETGEDGRRHLSIPKQRNGRTGKTRHEWLHRPTLSFWEFDLEAVDNGNASGTDERGGNQSASEEAQDDESGTGAGNGKAAQNGEATRPDGSGTDGAGRERADNSGGPQQGEGTSGAGKQSEVADCEQTSEEGFDVPEDQIPF